MVNLIVDVGTKIGAWAGDGHFVTDYNNRVLFEVIQMHWTVKASMTYEAAKTASKISIHARLIKIEDNTGKENDEKFESLLGALEKLLGGRAAGKENAPRWNPNVTCWKSNKQGHAQRECQTDYALRLNLNVTCWKCYKKGHVQRECPSDNALRRNPNMTCWSCNKKGHIQSECQQITSTQHLKGTPHGNEDALARRSSVESCERDLNADKKFGMETDISVRSLRMTTEDSWSVSEIQNAQLLDPDIRPITERKLKSVDPPSRQEITQQSDTGLFGTPYILRMASFFVSGRVMVGAHFDGN
ncbi:hypothetical protein AVEN_35756-1 [Araneus ventricosus]|uniref:CCHC-type domain-containing protein n=1 Tax=Araneus ventricosus TaxID=182803 RepID=A0A4Y2FL43_ARAVE|nr:hypothetical protein AVEN_35756-1 [Araneus ventricosus]